MTLLRTLLILVLLYYAFKAITRYLLPFLAQRWVKKAQENFKQQQGYVDPDEAKRREGEVKVESKPNTNSKSKSNKDELGDYIEYEEIEEN
jgi:hypothetical protein